MTRVFTIHVCPVCGFYDADPVLKRADGKPCFRCGQEAEKRLDLTRVARSAHAYRRIQARQSAPLMEPTQVVALEGSDRR